MELLMIIKKKIFYFTLDFDEYSLKSSSSNEIDKNYEITYGKVITIGNEIFIYPKILLQSSLIEFEES